MSPSLLEIAVSAARALAVEVVPGRLGAWHLELEWLWPRDLWGRDYWPVNVDVQLIAWPRGSGILAASTL